MMQDHVNGPETDVIRSNEMRRQTDVDMREGTKSLNGAEFFVRFGFAAAKCVVSVSVRLLRCFGWFSDSDRQCEVMVELSKLRCSSRTQISSIR